MAASQVRLLQLTSRKNTIGRELENLSMQKTSLTREMREVSREYQNSLSAKTFKWSTNSGATYVDLSYSNLMRPGYANNNVPYLITDNYGKVVLDSTYQKYAEMISPDGNPGGDWEAVRTDVISAVTGIPADKITNSVSTNATVEANADKVNDLLENEPVEPVERASAKEFIELAGVVSENDIADLYGSGTIDLGNSAEAASNLSSILNGILTNMSAYLTEDDIEAFTEACSAYEKDYSTLFQSSSEELSKSGTGFTKDGDNYKVDVQTMMDTLLGGYVSAGGSYTTSDSTGADVYLYRDKNGSEWQTWKTQHDAWQEEYDAAMSEYEGSVDTNNQVLTAEEESSIAFYDKIFSAIAENGWTSNPMVADNDYLNQMLQNNQYYITTVETATDNDGEEYFEYDTSIASNFDNIFIVNDTDAQEEALVEYEYQKSIINEKESRIDTRMQNLETEQAAINEMIKGIEQVRDDNSERNFSIMS